MRTAVLGGPGSRVPWPLVHRHEVNVPFTLHEGLGAVAVVHIPVDDENALDRVTLACIVRRDRDVTEQTEAHAARAERVVARRTHRAEAPSGATIEGHVDAIQHATRRR